MSRVPGLSYGDSLYSRSLGDPYRHFRYHDDMIDPVTGYSVKQAMRLAFEAEHAGRSREAMDWFRTAEIIEKRLKEQCKKDIREEQEKKANFARRYGRF